MPDDKFLNENEDKKSFLVGEEEYCDFIGKNPNYEKSPHINWEKRKVEKVSEYDNISEITQSNSSNKPSQSTTVLPIDEGFVGLSENHIFFDSNHDNSKKKHRLKLNKFL